MSVVFRVDASNEIGTGHLTRCLALAEVIRKKGQEVVFVMRSLPGHLTDAIVKLGFKVCPLPWIQGQPYGGRDHAGWLGVSWEQDAEECATLLSSLKPDWLIVDHYALDARWEIRVHSLVPRLMVIDDLADRPHDCDILLDQNLAENSHSRYQTLTPKSAIQLLGPSFALLRSEFADLRQKGISVRGSPIRRVVISFGGIDLSDATSLCLHALRELTESHLSIDVIVGAGNPHHAEVERLCQSMPNARFFRQPSNMAELFLQADVGIGASGSTTWERCCLGLPSILIALAKNQEVVGEGCRQADMAVYLGAFDQVGRRDIRAAVDKLNEGDRLAELSRKCAAMIDGLGTLRVQEALISCRRPVLS